VVPSVAAIYSALYHILVCANVPKEEEEQTLKYAKFHTI
jgi:hypothetical protein